MFYSYYIDVQLSHLNKDYLLTYLSYEQKSIVSCLLAHSVYRTSGIRFSQAGRHARSCISSVPSCDRDRELRPHIHTHIQLA